jgi:hypothetical protein
MVLGKREKTTSILEALKPWFLMLIEVKVASNNNQHEKNLKL